jgi:hypothetical protein
MRLKKTIEERNAKIYKKAQEKLKNLGIDLSTNTIYQVHRHKSAWIEDNLRHMNYVQIMDNGLGTFKLYQKKVNERLDILHRLALDKPELREQIDRLNQATLANQEYLKNYKKNAANSTINSNDTVGNKIESE